MFGLFTEVKNRGGFVKITKHSTAPAIIFRQIAAMLLNKKATGPLAKKWYEAHLEDFELEDDEIDILVPGDVSDQDEQDENLVNTISLYEKFKDDLQFVLGATR